MKERKNKKEKKEKKPNKFIETIKKKWLINTSKTFLLVAIIIAIFIGINIVMHKLELLPLDLSQDKLYTLTEDSKQRVKKINKDINIYFVGFSNDDAILTLAKQYKKENERIIAEAIDPNNRPDIAEKYQLEDDVSGIIVECGEKSKVLDESDLMTYDAEIFQEISIAEEKLTSAIASVSADKVPKVYFLESYSEISLHNGLNYLNMYMENEVMEVNSIDILTTGKIPEDCDTLVITTPEKDFDDVTTQAIIDYSNSGKNILWLNAAVVQAQEFSNVNKILKLYGIQSFDIGVIRETDSEKMIIESPDIIKPNMQYTLFTQDLYNTAGVILVNPTKLNINEDDLENNRVTKTDILTVNESAYFRTNFNIQTKEPQENEEKGPFIIGAQLEKIVKEANKETGEKEVKSTLIIYGENYFVSDFQLTQDSQYPALQLAYNKDLILNSIAYLTDREEDVVSRKRTGTVIYAPTEQQDTIVRIIIFAVPIVIILAGIIVWQKRRRKK